MARPLHAWFAEEQLLHTPQQYMRIGRIAKPADVPGRAQVLLEALQGMDVPVGTPADVGRVPLHKVHAPAYLEFLASAWTRWQELSIPGVERGIEVLPNLSPYVCGSDDQPRRGPCPSPALLAQVGWYVSDLSCPIGEQTWPAILRSAHTAIAAAQHVIDHGGLSYALCRPSGHHARTDRASGFCYVNNTACAAATLQQRHSRIAVLDVDAHHGDGTQQIFYCRDDVLTISMHATPDAYFPFYTGREDEVGVGRGRGYNLNLPLPVGSGNDWFLGELERALGAIREFRPDALVLALGFDTFKDDPISVLKLDMDAYEEIGRRVGALALPTVVVQEGGYLVDAIGEGLTRCLGALRAV